MTCTKNQKDIAPSEVPAIWIPGLLSKRSKITYSCGVKAKPDDNLNATEGLKKMGIITNKGTHLQLIKHLCLRKGSLRFSL